MLLHEISNGIDANIDTYVQTTTQVATLILKPILPREVRRSLNGVFAMIL
ncbi:hypothetical protein OH492_19015 [Vibrio chagasii]|nr:hypothetical protein [Vibrio chagasii]